MLRNNEILLPLLLVHTSISESDTTSLFIALSAKQREREWKILEITKKLRSGI